MLKESERIVDAVKICGSSQERRQKIAAVSEEKLKGKTEWK
jgi:hypothetical protein